MPGLLTIALGVVTGILVGVSVQWWKSNRDELRILCDEFCRVVTDATDLGSKYWLSTNEPGSSIYEARLVGIQGLLEGYRVLLSKSLSEKHCNLIRHANAEFFDTLTGGEFMSPDRAADPSRVFEIQKRASDLILSIRRGFYESVRFGTTVVRLVRRTTRCLPALKSRGNALADRILRKPRVLDRC
jgi:hypothetical protein